MIPPQPIIPSRTTLGFSAPKACTPPKAVAAAATAALWVVCLRNLRRVVRDVDSTLYAEAAPEDIVAMPASLSSNQAGAGPTLSDLLSS